MSLTTTAITPDAPSTDARYARAAAVAHTLLRVFAGALFMQHGAQKLFGAFGGPMGNGTGVPLMSLFGLAGVIELVGGFLIVIGFFTRAAAFLASGEMATAYFMMHFPHGFWPIQNRGEIVVLFCFVFLYLAASGAGPWSVDGALFGRRGGIAGTGATRPTFVP